MHRQGRLRRRPRRLAPIAGAVAVALVSVLVSSCVPPPNSGPGPTTTSPPVGPPPGTVELRVGGGSLSFGDVVVDLAAADLTVVGQLSVEGGLVFDSASTSTTPVSVEYAAGGQVGASVELRLVRDATGSLDRRTGDVTLDLDARLRVVADGSTDFPDVGQGCHIGSTASPIELRLTTATTSGRPLGPDGTAALVDDSFRVPGAVGCVLFPLTLFVNETFGVPSPAGANSARLAVELVAAPD